MMKISGLDSHRDYRFELGKCYEHINGKQIYVCGVADTLALGRTFIVETGDIKGEESFNFKPVDLCDLDYYVEGNRWFEIPIEKFQLCNYINSDKEIIKLQNGIKEFERKRKLANIKQKIH